PGGNMTGLALGTGDGFGGKWVELFKETLPQVSHVGLVRNPDARGQERVESEVRTAGARLGGAFNRLSVRSLDDPDAAFAAATRAHLGGLIVLTDPLTLRHRARIVQLASQTRLPAVYGFGEFARAGGLMAYGPSVTDLARRAAVYVDKILRGADPGNVPIEEPTRVDVLVNRKTATALGVTIPPSVLARADQVIE